MADYEFSRSERRVLARNMTRPEAPRGGGRGDAGGRVSDALLQPLLHLWTRHPGGGMAFDMLVWPDFVAMVEDTAVRTHLVEYRTQSLDKGPGDLIACALVDQLSDGLSLVYSFYDPAQTRSSLGSFVILDHIRRASRGGVPFVYLGYWVEGSHKMDYKAQSFRPLELLRPERLDPAGQTFFLLTPL